MRDGLGEWVRVRSWRSREEKAKRGMVLEEHWQGYIACRQPPAAIRLITARHTCGDVSSKRDADLPLLTCRLLAVAGWQGREKHVGLIL